MKQKPHLIVLLMLCITAAAVMLPVVYTICNSFMSREEIVQTYLGGSVAFSSFHLLPDTVSFDAYYQIFLRRPDYLLKFWNSLGWTLLMVTLQILVVCPTAYGFSRFRFPGREALFFVIVLLMLLPYQVTLVANYLVLDQMGILGSWWAVVLPSIFSPLGVFILRQSMAAIPTDLLEAARLDGAGELRTLTWVVLPQCRGGIASVVILSFVEYWNMVEQPLMFLSDWRQYPLSIFLAQANSRIPEIGFACGVLAMLPVVMLYLFFEDALVEGIAASTKF